MAGLEKVSRNAPLAIPAGSWNTMVDSAIGFVRGRRQGFAGAGPAGSPAGPVRIQNASGADVARFGILRASGLVFEAADNLTAFLGAGWLLKGDKPAGAKDALVVASEPIAAGKIGWGVAMGFTPVQVDVGGESHAFAKPIKDDATKLKSAGSGPVRLLYKEAGTGVKWALAGIGVGGAGAFNFARITAKAGSSAPWKYAGVETDYDAASDAFADAAGGDAFDYTLNNLMERGPGGAGVNPVEVDSIVMYFPLGDEYGFVATNYKGTY